MLFSFSNLLFGIGEIDFFVVDFSNCLLFRVFASIHRVNGLLGVLTFMKVYSMVIEMWKCDIITIANTLTSTHTHLMSEDFRFVQIDFI